MNRFLLQGFLLLALIPIGWFFTKLLIGLVPIICWGFAINAYKANNDKELYFWLFIGLIGFFIALYVLGIL
mgnify:FL=1